MVKPDFVFHFIKNRALKYPILVTKYALSRNSNLQCICVHACNSGFFAIRSTMSDSDLNEISISPDVGDNVGSYPANPSFQFDTVES